MTCPALSIIITLRRALRTRSSLSVVRSVSKSGESESVFKRAKSNCPFSSARSNREKFPPSSCTAAVCPMEIRRLPRSRSFDCRTTSNTNHPPAKKTPSVRTRSKIASRAGVFTKSPPYIVTASTYRNDSIPLCPSHSFNHNLTRDLPVGASPRYRFSRAWMRRVSISLTGVGAPNSLPRLTISPLIASISVRLPLRIS